MAAEPEPLAVGEQQRAVAQLLQSTRCPFGPRFFLGQLAAFVRDRCPERSERLPTLELWLPSGDILSVCHVIGLAPQWVALAARGAKGEMRTEIVPYELVVRVTVGTAPRDGMGFERDRRPVLVSDQAVSPEEALAIAAGAGPSLRER